ncbi:nuclear transport factor 2 family protein [Frankia sp. R82]|uniref:nuclear transport factor 2 family protein n=1 Tax=Frankia sp. R82 TaxID=2950553 RepID=UPI002043DB6F|nr:nuclear transport factor 2 family protein [Frankia sp. R82]MCM3882157.1 ester cyclase [Frankia sp. R82]
MRSPREVVELYNYELWNNQRYELAAELIGETVVRHEIGGVRTISHAEAVARVVDTWAMVKHLTFVLLQVIADGDRVCIVYECHAERAAGEPVSVTSSMEIFRVVDGRIREVWNMAYTKGRWQ